MAKNTTSHSIRNESCEKVEDYIHRLYGDAKVSTRVSPFINALIEIFDYDRDKNKLIKQIKKAQETDGRKTRHLEEAPKKVEEKPTPVRKVVKKKTSKKKSSDAKLLAATKRLTGTN